MMPSYNIHTYTQEVRVNQMACNVVDHSIVKLVPLDNSIVNIHALRSYDINIVPSTVGCGEQIQGSSIPSCVWHCI